MRIDCCGNLYTGLLLCNIANLRYVQTKIEGIIKEKPMAEKKKVLYIVEAMGGGVFTYIVDLANELVNSYDMYTERMTCFTMVTSSCWNVQKHWEII